MTSKRAFDLDRKKACNPGFPLSSLTEVIRALSNGCVMKNTCSMYSGIGVALPGPALRYHFSQCRASSRTWVARNGEAVHTSINTKQKNRTLDLRSYREDVRYHSAPTGLSASVDVHRVAANISGAGPAIRACLDVPSKQGDRNLQKYFGMQCCVPSGAKDLLYSREEQMKPSDSA